ncbi:hypothetical protein SDC9_137168 [bioreactor metagenome]|uniref:Uncharacterized protein n=1 Tax=bioreactor metagenome TaxID=1076179 RepID=A0A645DNE0_9ZZZZ
MITPPDDGSAAFAGAAAAAGAGAAGLTAADPSAEDAGESYLEESAASTGSDNEINARERIDKNKMLLYLILM